MTNHKEEWLKELKSGKISPKMYESMINERPPKLFCECDPLDKEQIQMSNNKSIRDLIINDLTEDYYEDLEFYRKNKTVNSNSIEYMKFVSSLTDEELLDKYRERIQDRQSSQYDTPLED